MMKTNYVKLFSLCIFITFLSSCSDSGGSQIENGNALAIATNPIANERIEFLIDWQPEPSYIGIYYAKDVGLFSEAGYDVEVIPSWGANQAVAAVAAGTYPIATASGGATVLSRNSTEEVVSLGVIYEHIASVVYGLVSPNQRITKPTDLYDKRIGIYPSSITKNEFDAFVALNNLDSSKFIMQPISGGDIPLLREAKIDAVLHYLDMSPALVQVSDEFPLIDGLRRWEISLAEFGVGGYGLNIVTSRTQLSEDREKVTRLFKAAVAGYERGCEFQEDAVNRFMDRFPDKNRDHIEYGWARVCGELLMLPVGSQTVAAWVETVEMYKSLGLLTKPVEAKTLLAQ